MYAAEHSVPQITTTIFFRFFFIALKFFLHSFLTLKLKGGDIKLIFFFFGGTSDIGRTVVYILVLLTFFFVETISWR